MNRTRKYLAALSLLALAGCGKVGPLQPVSGQQLPATAYGQAEPADAITLMQPSEQSRPGRSDELMRRSERRVDDPFDLPPGEDIPDEPAPTPPAKIAAPK